MVIIMVIIMVDIANWKITIFKNGKSTNFLWAMFNSYVKLPEGTNH